MVSGERPLGALPPIPAGRRLLAVCGAHLSGQPLNSVLTDAGARLYQRGRTAPGYRIVRLEGAMPRPGLLDDGTGPSDGIDVELWDAPTELVQQLADDVEPPLEIGQVRLWDGSAVAGFTANPSASRAADISAAGSWRAHLASRRTTAPPM
jgi:allophanate hydrolase